MGLACTMLSISLSKVIHEGHLQWDSMIKRPIAWGNLYGGISLGMGDTIYIPALKDILGLESLLGDQS